MEKKEKLLMFEAQQSRHFIRFFAWCHLTEDFQLVFKNAVT